VSLQVVADAQSLGEAHAYKTRYSFACADEEQVALQQPSNQDVALTLDVVAEQACCA